MKKSLSKPENWQDFESLCKKLFGEIWNCKNTIRKNGRSGQDQSGVDVYAIPKGEDGYFGIQCKGKDDYTKAKVTKKEVLTEVAKALKFEPKLKAFIITTTANKDAAIETFIRNEDLNSRKNGDFEIQLYSWEDLVDLIEENRETYLWYINGQQFRDKYECSILLDGQTSTVLKPVYNRKITIYITEAQERASNNSSINAMLNFNKRLGIIYPHHFNQKKRQFNYSICPLQISIKNIGSKVLEDWKLQISFDSTQIKKLCKNYEGEEGGYEALSMNLMKSINTHHRQSLSVNENELNLVYKPNDNHPLIQLDNRTFTIWLQPINHELQEINLRWKLLARDYDATGEISIAVEPIYERSYKQILLDEKEDEKDNESEVFEKIDDKKEE